MNGESASRMNPRGLWQRVSLDVLLFAFVGFVMAELGPYRTLEVPKLLRTAYWLLAVFGSGAVAILAERYIARFVRGFWLRVVAVSVLITPPVTLYIYALNAVMLDLPRTVDRKRGNRQPDAADLEKACALAHPASGLDPQWVESRQQQVTGGVAA